MKRVISFLLCVLMAFLCACNSQVNSDQLTAAQKLNNEPELTQQQADRLVDLMAKLESYRGGGAVQKQVKAELEKVEWVEKVEETEDGGLTCYTDFGVTAVWTPDPKKEKLEDLKQIKLETTLSSSEVVVKQIAILCPYASTEPDFNADDYVALGKDLGGSISCNVTVFKDEEVSLDLMKNLGKYDMVWIRTLGGINCLFDSTLALIGKEPYIMIGEKVATAEDCIKHSGDFLRGRIVLNLRDGRLGVSGKFFEHHYGADALAGTFFHIAANFSMKTNAFADALISRGAVWVEGWSGEVNYNNDYVQFANVVSGLLKGKSVEQAVKDASNAVKSSDSFYQSNCTLIGKGNTAYNIKQRVESSAPSDGKVRLEATSADFSTLTDMLYTLTCDYDCEADNALYQAFNVLLGQLGMYPVYFDDVETVYESADPLKKFRQPGYLKYPAETVDWAFKNMFNVTPDHNYIHEVEEYRGGKYVYGYYYDGFYYAPVMDIGFVRDDLQVSNYKKDSNGTYYIDLKVVYSEGFTMARECFSVTADLIEVDGKRVWSFKKLQQAPLLITTYEADYSVRADDGIRSGKRIIIVKDISENVATMQYQETDSSGVTYTSTEFKFDMNNTSNKVQWKNDVGDVFNATITYSDIEGRADKLVECDVKVESFPARKGSGQFYAALHQTW